MKQNILAERKPRIEMEKMAGNGPGILADKRDFFLLEGAMAAIAAA